MCGVCARHGDVIVAFGFTMVSAGVRLAYLSILGDSSLVLLVLHPATLQNMNVRIFARHGDAIVAFGFTMVSAGVRLAYLSILSTRC